MNGKKARLIRKKFKEAGFDVFKAPDYRVSNEKEVMAKVNEGGQVVIKAVKRQTIVNQTKYGYRRAKKDLIRGNVEM